MPSKVFEGWQANAQPVVPSVSNRSKSGHKNAEAPHRRSDTARAFGTDSAQHAAPGVDSLEFRHAQGLILHGY
jgi:hypothetical protein